MWQDETRQMIDEAIAEHEKRRHQGRRDDEQNVDRDEQDVVQDHHGYKC